MLTDVLHTRIREYSPANVIEQENVLQELMQHYVLASLSRSGLFSEAVFHGGTCLRIVHGMNRFSEDLDFLLKRSDPSFAWQKHLARVTQDCALEGLHFEVQDKTHAVDAVRKAFLKTDSIGKILTLELPFERHGAKKIRIKLEIDTNPPEGSSFETAYLSFPMTTPITTQTLGSGFGTKAHALLCRQYVKGRDWYDFVWYVARQTVPDLDLLGNALLQQGPWQGERIDVTRRWFLDALSVKIESIDWPAAREDVRRFVPLGEQPGLESWSTDFFLYHVKRLTDYLPG